MKARKRTQVERSEETKKRLMEAALEILSTRGYSCITIKEIADHIGVSRGAPVHHFSTRASLIQAVVEYSCEVAQVETMRLANEAMSSKDPLGKFIDGVAEYYLSDSFLHHLEILFAARVGDEGQIMRLRLAEFRDAADEAWFKVLRRVDLPLEDTRKIFHLTLNLVRGMGLHNAWRPDPAIHNNLKAWKKIVRRLVEAHMD